MEIARKKAGLGPLRAGPHNRLLRRQHCSSLCSQSEGHEHVANMTSALGHDLVGFSARAGPPQYSPPSLCEQSELQCFAPGLRQMSARCPLQRCRIRYAIWLKTAQRLFLILNTLTVGEEMHYLYSNTSRWRRNTAKALSARACISSSPG